MDVQAIVTTLGAILIGSGVIGAVLRSLFGHLLSRDLENFRAGLQATHDIEIERLRADLRAAAFEHETRFGKLHEERAQVIAELYTRLARAQQKITAVTSPMQYYSSEEAKEQEEQERKKAAAEDADAFSQYFNEKQIFLDEELCSQIDIFNRLLRGALVNFTVSSYNDKDGRDTRWESWKTVTEKIPEIRKAIEREFRGLLGVGTTSKLQSLDVD